MPTAIIIGFEYSPDSIPASPDSKTNDHFPGTIIDLYRAYQFCIEQKWVVHIITDIAADKFPTTIQALVTSGRVGLRVMTFYDSIKEHLCRVRTSKDLHSALCRIYGEISQQAISEVFFYFSGHSYSSAIVLPNDDKVDFIEIRNLLSKSLSEKCSVLMVMDCCYPNAIYLPYTLCAQDGRFRLNTAYIPVLQQIMVIASAAETQTSIATQSGSLFSQYLFEYLRLFSCPLIEEQKSSLYIEGLTLPLCYGWPSRHLGFMADFIMRRIKQRTIKNKIKHVQTVSMYSSYPITPLLYSWIGVGVSGTRVDIDYSTKTIILNK